MPIPSAIRLIAAVAAVAGTLGLAAPAPARVLEAPGGPAGNVISCENSKPGQPSTIWDVVADGDPSIQGFASPFSVNRGGRVDFKIDSPAPQIRIEIFRMGYYDGNGAR